MPGLWSRVKTWLNTETITAADLNAEFDNVNTNFVPQQMDDYSANVTQMQQQTNPGAQGSESLATSLAGEIERIRFALSRAVGLDFWYDDPETSLASLKQIIDSGLVLPSNRIDSGEVDANNQPMFLQINNSTSAKLECSSTSFRAYVDNVLTTQSTDLVSSALAGPASFTCQVNTGDIGSQGSKQRGETSTTPLTIDTNSGSAPTAGSYQAWKVVHSAVTEYFYGRFVSSTRIDKCFRGWFFNSSNVAVPRVALSDNDVITLCRAVYFFFTNAGGTPALDFTYTRPSISFDQPAGAASGDFWFDLSERTWKKYNGVSWIAASAVFVGIGVMDGSSLVAVRSADFDKGFTDLNTVYLEKFDNATILSSMPSASINVYGTLHQFRNERPTWSMATDLDSGVTEAASTSYALYITDKGDEVISDVLPQDRRGSLLGWYHPSKPWRSTGFVFNNASQNLEDPNKQEQIVAEDIQDGAVTQAKRADATDGFLSNESPAVNTALLVLTTSYQDVGSTNLAGTETIVGSGRPVLATVALVVVAGSSTLRFVTIQLLQGSTVLRNWVIPVDTDIDTGVKYLHRAFIVPGVEGSTTYKLQAKVDNVSLGAATIYSVGDALNLSLVSNNSMQEMIDGTGTATTRALEIIEL